VTLDTYGHLFPRGDDGAELAAAKRALLGRRCSCYVVTFRGGEQTSCGVECSQYLAVRSFWFLQSRCVLRSSEKHKHHFKLAKEL